MFTTKSKNHTKQIQGQQNMQSTQTSEFQKNFQKASVNKDILCSVIQTLFLVEILKDIVNIIMHENLK